MKAQRQRKILELITKYHVETQEDLIARLFVEGINATQATISRDIREMHLTKVLTSKGTYRYMPPRKEDEKKGNLKLTDTLVDSITSLDCAQNIVVVRTSPGLAQAVAAGVDKLITPDVLGCVAGDDTILIVTRNNETAKLMCEQFHLMIKIS